MPRVALHPEGVDRNEEYYKKAKAAGVALHPEGVDRNFEGDGETEVEEVALHPEGVDRNFFLEGGVRDAQSRPPPGGRG